MARNEIPTYTINQLITAAHANTYWKNNEAAHWLAIDNYAYDYELIEDIVLSVNGTFDFTSIPQTYTNLELVLRARANLAGTSHDVRMRFNNISTAAYDYQIFTSSSTVVTASEGLAKTFAYIGTCPGTSSGAGLYSGIHIFIPNYRVASVQKSAIVSSGSPDDTASVHTVACHWRRKAAIRRITIYAAANFLPTSMCSLYGRV